MACACERQRTRQDPTPLLLPASGGRLQNTRRTGSQAQGILICSAHREARADGVQALLINPRCRIYDAKFTSPMAALVSGIAPPPHQQAASSLFQCMRPVAVPA